MSNKVINPKTNRFITKGGYTHRRLVREGHMKYDQENPPIIKKRKYVKEDYDEFPRKERVIKKRSKLRPKFKESSSESSSSSSSSSSDESDYGDYEEDDDYVKYEELI